VEKFLADHDLLGLKWRMLEAGRQGMTVESTVSLLRALGISANWFLFGIEPIYLNEVEGKRTVPSIDEMLRQIVLGPGRHAQGAPGQKEAGSLQVRAAVVEGGNQAQKDRLEIIK